VLGLPCASHGFTTSIYEIVRKTCSISSWWTRQYWASSPYGKLAVISQPDGVGEEGDVGQCRHDTLSEMRSWQARVLLLGSFPS